MDNNTGAHAENAAQTNRTVKLVYLAASVITTLAGLFLLASNLAENLGGGFFALYIYDYNAITLTSFAYILPTATISLFAALLMTGVGFYGMKKHGSPYKSAMPVGLGAFQLVMWAYLTVNMLGGAGFLHPVLLITGWAASIIYMVCAILRHRKLPKDPNEGRFIM